jgi:hypothetical protein
MFDIGSMPLLIDYSLCKQSVTVYHFENNEVTSTYFPIAKFEFTETQKVDKVGSSEEDTFLLVIPGNAIACSVGDKVLLGQGEQPSGDHAAFWRSLIPAKVDNLGVVRKVHACYWNGEICHTEARG